MGDLTDEQLEEQAEHGSLGPKVKAWLRQRGKSREAAMAEYVALVSLHSSKVKVTCDKILDGTIRDFNYKSKNADVNKINESSGGAL